FLIGCLRRTPDTYHLAGIKRGTATSNFHVHRDNLEMEDPVTSTETGPDNAERIIESLQDAENSALEAVRKFLDTVNGVFSDFTAEGGPRQKIIDSAFKMTEQLVGTSTQLAEKIVKVGQNVLSESEKDG
ncbi:MAG TPA: hypothetical protein VFC03_18670, partial [Acidimicrobiales bacterium]|nr:hypothetical protein [Acidimicrobiales bacterium]